MISRSIRENSKDPKRTIMREPSAPIDQSHILKCVTPLNPVKRLDPPASAPPIEQMQRRIPCANAEGDINNSLYVS